MANKTWKYTVTYQSPEDFDKTPAKRGEEFVDVEATTAKRAIAKATKEIVDEWAGVDARDIVILDALRTGKWEAV